MATLNTGADAAVHVMNNAGLQGTLFCVRDIKAHCLRTVKKVVDTDDVLMVAAEDGSGEQVPAKDEKGKEVKLRREVDVDEIVEEELHTLWRQNVRKYQPFGFAHAVYPSASSGSTYGSTVKFNVERLGDYVRKMALKVKRRAIVGVYEGTYTVPRTDPAAADGLARDDKGEVIRDTKVGKCVARGEFAPFYVQDYGLKLVEEGSLMFNSTYTLSTTSGEAAAVALDTQPDHGKETRRMTGGWGPMPEHPLDVSQEAAQRAALQAHSRQDETLYVPLRHYFTLADNRALALASVNGYDVHYHAKLAAAEHLIAIPQAAANHPEMSSMRLYVRPDGMTDDEIEEMLRPEESAAGASGSGSAASAGAAAGSGAAKVRNAFGSGAATAMARGGALTAARGGAFSRAASSLVPLASAPPEVQLYVAWILAADEEQAWLYGNVHWVFVQDTVREVRQLTAPMIGTKSKESEFTLKTKGWYSNVQVAVRRAAALDCSTPDLFNFRGVVNPASGLARSPLIKLGTALGNLVMHPDEVPEFYRDVTAWQSFGCTPRAYEVYTLPLASDTSAQCSQPCGGINASKTPLTLRIETDSSIFTPESPTAELIIWISRYNIFRMSFVEGFKRCIGQN